MYLPNSLFNTCSLFHCSVMVAIAMYIVSLFNLQVLCLGVLIAAAVAISAINELDDLAMEQDLIFENASSSRGAAGWLVFACCVALIFHAVMITIQIFYFKCGFKKVFRQYVFIVS